MESVESTGQAEHRLVSPPVGPHLGASLPGISRYRNFRGAKRGRRGGPPLGPKGRRLPPPTAEPCMRRVRSRHRRRERGRRSEPLVVRSEGGRRCVRIVDWTQPSTLTVRHRSPVQNSLPPLPGPQRPLRFFRRFIPAPPASDSDGTDGDVSRLERRERRRELADINLSHSESERCPHQSIRRYGRNARTRGLAGRGRADSCPLGHRLRAAGGLSVGAVIVEMSRRRGGPPCPSSATEPRSSPPTSYGAPLGYHGKEPTKNRYGGGSERNEDVVIVKRERS